MSIHRPFKMVQQRRDAKRDTHKQTHTHINTRVLPSCRHISSSILCMCYLILPCISLYPLNPPLSSTLLPRQSHLVSISASRTPTVPSRKKIEKNPCTRAALLASSSLPSQKCNELREEIARFAHKCWIKNLAAAEWGSGRV